MKDDIMEGRVERDYESISSVGSFLSCPRSYYYSRILNIPAKVSKQVELGSWVHKQLENWARGYEIHPDAEPFIYALQDFLQSQNEKILQMEHEFHIYVDGFKFKGVIDAICQNIALEYKITSNPDNFRSKISYQLALYAHYLRAKGIKPVYLLFEVNKYGRFQNLHVEYVPITDLLIEKRLQELVTAVKLINQCKEVNCFPPSWNGCKWCFYKDYCDEYMGG